MILDLFFLVSGCLFLFIFAYLFFLAIASLWPEKPLVAVAPKNRFALVIPAHNEAELIGDTLSSIRASDYPQDLYEIIVVADNCEDDTKKIVEGQKVNCWQRTDLENRGKGNVLKWVFPRLLEYGDHDAYVVIDADTHLEKDFLQRINDHFCNGAQVVQGYSQVRHPEFSPMESLAFLGFALNRNLRYRGRSRLGWTSNLMGTGMCFLRTVIENHGWNTTTMVEDIEYEMMLHLNGIRVLFASDAKINVELHRNVNQSQEQRTRWDMGKFEVRNYYLPRLLKEGFTRKDISYFDSAMELILPPFSLLCVLVLSGCLLFTLFGYGGVNVNFYIWLTVFLGLFSYIFLGLLTARANIKVYTSLVYAPFFIFWRLWIVLLEMLRKNKSRQW
jgi:cellulose synthase/poly-beta-1,6-N-acetylglucosamine synthase-like glycosyltransferase